MKQRIFGNPFGQFLLILAEIVGLAGSAYLGIQCLILTNSFGGLFEGENLLKGIMSFGTLFLPVLMLFIAFVGTIVGLVEKNRGVGVMSVIFVLLAMLVQGVCFVVGYADLANFFQNINWGGFFDLGLDLVILGYVVSVVAFIFALFAICFAAGRKKGASIVFAIIALILYIAAAFGYLFPLIRDHVGDPLELLAFFSGSAVASVELVPFIFFIVRGVFIFLVGLTLFVLVFEKSDKPAKGSKPTKGGDTKGGKDKKGGKETETEVIREKDRIIIEIR